MRQESTQKSTRLAFVRVRGIRAASTSHCKGKDLSLQGIMASAGWSNSETFAKFYDKPVEFNEKNFGNTLLGQ